ncbi:hypothetical protein LK12_00440 [Novosphingobium malaysiense]|uniref:Sensor protein FixL n=1 Tax=Novosphingobium malaysiense TaxID=1348853 RepID=A0A0B1ZWR1_9SPHN|nr:hypothetical protein LK12_00440 [Novosphingobium malaysiense]
MRSLRSKLDLLIDSASHHAICMLDPEGRVVIWNAGAERLYGWSESEVIGQPYDMMFDTADREAGLPGLQIEEARRRGTFSRRAWRLRKDGTRFLADGIVNRITDDSGNIMGFGQVVRDITEETEHARALATNEAQLRAILETVPDAMITIDEMGMILSFSATAESLFGYSSQEVIGRNVSMLMPDADAARHNGYLARYMSTGERHVIGNSRRVLGRRKDGTIFPHELYVGEADGGGHRIFTGFLRDLTTREEAEAKLRELQTELIVMSRISAVGTMATALAHELNQPLTAITNYTQSAAALMPAAEQAPLDLVREALEETGREAMRAGAIVRRLRDFVASGELDRISFSPRELAMQTADLALVGEATRNIHCTISIPPNLSPVLVDRVQVQQVLLNLIRNAIEALKENGTIAISANQESSMMRFSIMDSGPGVAPGKEEDVFEPFVSSKASGMGMGLPICRTIIEAHGGKLWCEAQPGQGGMFHFTVPVAEIDDD